MNKQIAFGWPSSSSTGSNIRTLPMASSKLHEFSIAKACRENAIYFCRKKGTPRDRTKRAIYGIAIIDESCAHFDVGEMS